MLDSNDLQAIAALLAQQKQEIMGETAALMAQQKKEIMRDVEILMENVFQPQFNLLSEKLDAALEKLAPSEALMAVEDRVDALEEVTALHSTEIESLKKAQ